MRELKLLAIQELAKKNKGPRSWMVIKDLSSCLSCSKAYFLLILNHFFSITENIQEETICQGDW
jgi:hypothetical protein